ncbi:MAG: arginine--tRNA ligase [Thermodesulfobacteriota bacterium]
MRADSALTIFLWQNIEEGSSKGSRFNLFNLEPLNLEPFLFQLVRIRFLFMKMKEKIIEVLKEAIRESREQGILVYDDMPAFSLEKPRRKEHGDFATNVAMLFSSGAGIPPRDIAEVIKGHVDKAGIIERIEIAGPGFMNIFVKRGYWHSMLKGLSVLEEGNSGINLGKGERVQVEFVSANPTGPLHIGHGRGAAIGDSVARILEFLGYDVTREYYINDVGRQIKTLGRSVLVRYKEILGEDAVFPEDGYRGEYIVDIAKEVIDKEGDRFKRCNPEDALQFFIRFAAENILKSIRDDLEDFGVEFDLWYSEKSLFNKGKVDLTMKELKDKGLTYEEEGALWFRSTDFGDDKDRVLKKADGVTTYFASDIAYHEEKSERGFRRIVDIWGADHHGYQPRIKAFLKAIGKEDDLLRVILVQLVSLLRGGEKVPMSTRGGEFVTLREVITEVGRDAARFFLLLRRSDSHLDFDLELAKKQTPENPVFYVQYAHARICSIISLAVEKGVEMPAFSEIDAALLNLQEEIDIIEALASFMDVLKKCAISFQPHHLTFYLQNLAGMFHSYYNSNRVISDDEELTLARLYLCKVVRIVIKNGLHLIGVSAPEKM